MASYTVNEAGLAKAKALIGARRYVVKSDWGDVQPDSEAENRFLANHSWDEYAEWHLGLTEGERPDQGALRLRVWGFPPGAPQRAYRLPLPRRRVVPQGNRARGARPPATPGRNAGGETLDQRPPGLQSSHPVSDSTAPIQTGYLAPAHGQGGMAFLLLGLFSLLILLAGALSPSLMLALVGGGGLALAGAGYALYWTRAKHWPVAHLYADRLEFVRGPQRGAVRFADVTAVQWLQWERSLFPYHSGHRVLVLQTPEAEWQVGVEIAGSAEFQDEVVAALNALARDRG